MSGKSIVGRAGFDAIFADRSVDIREIGEGLRSVVLDADPDATEAGWPGYGSVSYGLTGSGMSEAYCYLMPRSDRVNLGFYNGVALPDADGLLEGTGKNLRHIKVDDVKLTRDARVGRLVRLAVAKCRQATQARS